MQWTVDLIEGDQWGITVKINGVSFVHLFIYQHKKRIRKSRIALQTAKCDKSHCGNYCVLSIIHSEDSGPGAGGTVSEPGR